MFTKRSLEKELLDLGPNYYTATEYSDCLKKLFKVNKVLGVFRDTVKLLRIYPPESSLLDVGCGGGQFILHIHPFFPR